MIFVIFCVESNILSKFEYFESVKNDIKTSYDAQTDLPTCTGNYWFMTRARRSSVIALTAVFVGVSTEVPERRVDS